MKNLIQLEHDRMAWSLQTFPEATAYSSLLKAEQEIMEIKIDIQAFNIEPEEYADAIMCLFDSAGRQRITPEQIVEAYARKIDINKSRKWIKNADNTYSHIPYDQLTQEEQMAIDKATIPNAPINPPNDPRTPDDSCRHR